MGLLSSVGKFLTTTKTGKAISKTLDTLTIAVAHPVQTATAIVSKKSTLKDVTTAHFAQSQKEQIKDIIVGAVGIGATILGGAAVGAAAKAGTLAPKALAVGKALIPATAKGKVIAAVAAPVVIGAVAKEPTKSIKAAVSAPSELAQFGGDIATFAADPSLSTAKQIVTESPLLSAAAGILAVGGITKAAAPIISGALTRGAIQEQTEALTQGGVSVVDKSAGFQMAPTTPTLPQTAAVTTTTSKKRKRSVRKPVIQPISQRVNVLVQNKNTAYGIKNYIKREILA